MKKILLLFICLFFVIGLALGQNVVGEQSNAPCMVLSAGKSGANNLETAFCNVCSYWTNGIVPYTFDAAVSSIDRTRMENAINNASVGAGPYYGKTLYNALKTFIAHPLVLDAIPVGSDVWFMPGVFENAEGIYTKAMTLHAPFGGVVLR